ncbi:hypothetical protein B0H14DRAFT_3453873 [Mycena olivaceomarginata]|nr:hypothetical protein B0H14DRAFT_3453873 [Mycena olivaceomarginata]
MPGGLVSASVFGANANARLARWYGKLPRGMELGRQRALCNAVRLVLDEPMLRNFHPLAKIPPGYLQLVDATGASEHLQENTMWIDNETERTALDK